MSSALLGDRALTHVIFSGNVSSPSYTEPYRLYNLDVFEFELDSPMALYGSVPFMMSHKMESASGSGSQAAGFFWLNAAEMWVDVDKSEAGDGKATGAEASATTTTHWIAETGMLDAFIMLGPTPKDVLRQYYQLTGSLTLPQQFALGYHQCRWNYLDSGDVARVHAGFEEHDISVDVLWLDIEHTNGKRYFTWHDGKFPDPVAMQKELAAFGRKMVNGRGARLDTLRGPLLNSDLLSPCRSPSLIRIFTAMTNST